MIARVKAALLVGALGSALLATTGCTTESYCFSDCGPDAGGGTGGSAAADGGGTGGAAGFNTDGGGTGGSGGFVVPDAGDACAPTNGGVEICDSIDNDCNGKIDDGIDFTSPQSCGTCTNNCLQILGNLQGVDLSTVSCVPPAKLDGTVAGTCKFGKCFQDNYDLNGNPADGCEYYCVATGPEICDGYDNNCNGQVDEGIDVCDDVNNCGKCGKKCVLPNATAKCVSTATGAACDTTNTACQIDQCDPGYFDADGVASNGCEYACTPTGPEICDGVDNNCDGKIDNVDPALETDDPNIGTACFGGINGECAAAAHQGVSKCIGGQIKCCDVDSNNVNSTNPNLPVTGVRNGVCGASTGPQVLMPGDVQETCNGLDDNCDGQVDNNPIDAGGTCGSSVGNCIAGSKQCVSGALTCIGSTGPGTETCNGQDDNCDGVIDGTLTGAPVSCTSDADCTGGQVCLVRTGPSDKVCATPTSDAVGSCDVPPPPPAGSTSPCKAGTLACLGGAKTCVGSVKPVTSVDACGVDSNCDGTLTGQPNLQTDVHNCGSCGNDCTTQGGHIAWSCVNGACKNNGCDSNYLNCNTSNPDCETFCVKTSNTDQCNGVDDDCNCIVDDVPAAQKPTPVQVCGVAAGATEAGCTTGVSIACTGGSWKCTFPAGYCDNNAAPTYCAGVADVCDGKDNNCNGTADETYKFPAKTSGYLGQPCASDDGKAPPGDGACRTTGTYVCNGTTATKCNATTDLTKASAELCDGVDNDCDGLVDEPYTNKGSNATYYVKPPTTKISGSVWAFQYEASRPDATATTAGSGNGYQTSAPAGTTLDQTVACSTSGVVPWFNVTPVEAAQTCAARGGRLCKLTDWQTACHAGAACTRGYAPNSAPSCTTNGTYVSGSPPRLCNIGPFDFDPGTAGIQDGLLPTASSSLASCYANWTGAGMYDIEGNLREITWDNALSGASCNITDPNGNDGAASTTCLFPLMGGAFDTQSEDGASCDFSFYKVKRAFKLYDTGFRCCFDSNPD